MLPVSTLVGYGGSSLDDTDFSPGNNTYVDLTAGGLAPAPASVPEPSSIALCGIAGAIGLAVARVRCRRA